MIKALIFDIDNTILDFDKCSRSSILYACKKYNLPFSEDLFAIFKETTNYLFRKISNKELLLEDLRNVRWKIVFEKLNIKGIEPTSFEDEFRIHMKTSCDLVDGAKEIIEYLSTKYALYCASNSPANQQEIRMGNAGLLKYFKKLFVSGDIGLYKPNKDFFDYCFSNLDGIKNNEVIMIGDDIYADVKGSLEYGMQSCYFNKYKTKEIIDVNPTYTITSLLDLKTFL